MSSLGAVQAGNIHTSTPVDTLEKGDVMETLKKLIPKDQQEILFHFNSSTIAEINELDQKNDLSQIIENIKKQSVEHFEKEIAPFDNTKMVSLVNFVFNYHYYFANSLENERALEHALSFSLFYLLLKNKGIFPKSKELIFKTPREDLFYKNFGDEWRKARNDLILKFKFSQKKPSEEMLRSLFEPYGLFLMNNATEILFKIDAKEINLLKKNKK